MKILKRNLKVILVSFLAYLAIGNLLHLVIFPEDKTDISNYWERHSGHITA